jgi:hypothetical protein
MVSHEPHRLLNFRFPAIFSMKFFLQHPDRLLGHYAPVQIGTRALSPEPKERCVKLPLTSSTVEVRIARNYISTLPHVLMACA